MYLRGRAGQKITKSVSVKAGEKEALTLEESSFNLSTKVAYTVEEVEPGRLFRIHFTTIPGPPGNYRGVLKLRTNYPERPQIVIPIMARLHGVGAAQKGSGK